MSAVSVLRLSGLMEVWILEHSTGSTIHCSSAPCTPHDYGPLLSHSVITETQHSDNNVQNITTEHEHYYLGGRQPPGSLQYEVVWTIGDRNTAHQAARVNSDNITADQTKPCYLCQLKTERTILHQLLVINTKLVHSES